MKKRYKFIIACGVSWILLVIGFVFLVQPYGSRISSSEMQNLLAWVTIPPILFAIISSIFGWATKEDMGNLNDDVANISLSSKASLSKSNPSKKTAKEFDEIRFINTAELVREKFLAIIKKDNAHRLIKDGSLLDLANNDFECYMPDGSMLIQNWDDGLRDDQLPPHRNPHYMYQVTASEYSIVMSLTAGTWKDIDFNFRQAMVTRLVKRLNKKVEAVIDCSSDAYHNATLKYPSPESNILSGMDIRKLKSTASNIVKQICEKAPHPFLPLYDIWGVNWCVFHNVLSPEQWDKRLKQTINADLRLLGEATGLQD